MTIRTQRTAKRKGLRSAQNPSKANTSVSLAVYALCAQLSGLPDQPLRLGVFRGVTRESKVPGQALPFSGS